MSTIQEKVQNVQMSFGRCSINPSFMKDFYSAFFVSHPSIKEYFKNTDMSKQTELLKNGLTYLIMYAGGSGVAISKINKLGETHSKAGMNIPPNIYVYWVNSLLKTIKIHDQKMNNDLFNDWKEVVLIGIEKIKSLH